jgi:hypothetical protein
MEDRPAVIICIGKPDVETRSLEPVIKLLKSFIPDLLERNRNRVQFQVIGFNDDPRELYEIPEVREYFKQLFQREPALFYWLDVDAHMLLLLCLMLYEPVISAEGPTVSLPDLQSFLATGYVGLEAFCKQHGLSAEPTHHAIKKWLGIR